MSSLRLQLLMGFLAAVPALAKTQVFYNGRIPIPDSKKTVADWVAVTDGKVVGYGIKEHFESFETAEKIDLHGKKVALKSLTTVN